MAATALVLVLVAATLHATWNLVLHGAEDRVPVMAIGNLAGGVLLSPWLVGAHLGRVVWLFVAAGTAQALYSASLSAAYRRGTLSVAYPLARGTAPLVVTLLGLIVLSQRPGPAALAGAAALAGGLGLIAVTGHRRRDGTSVFFGLLTGLFIASYSVLDARAVRSVSPLGYLSAELLVAGGLLVLAVGRHPARLRASLRPGAQVALGSTVGYLLVLFAFQRASAGRVATMRELSVLIGIVAARERPGRVIWAGAALVVAGAALAGS